MTLKAIKNADGTFAVYDTDSQQTVFDGTKSVQVPTQVFVGSLAGIQNQVMLDTAQVSMAQAQLASVQSKLTKDQAVLAAMQAG